jgi:hypothetical protein
MIEFKNNHEIINLIWEIFGFLKGNYSIIKIIQQDKKVFWVNLEGKCTINIHRDTWGEVSVSIGQKGIPDDWKYRDGLEFVIYYITNKKVLIADDILDLDDTKFQLTRYSKILKKYISKIENFTTSESYLEQRELLKSYYFEAVPLQAKKILSNRKTRNFISKG